MRQVREVEPSKLTFLVATKRELFNFSNRVSKTNILFQVSNFKINNYK